MKKIVYIGGGNGVMNVVPALKNDYEITAIVTTFDDGGSYGRLRGDYKSVLSGDVRRALSALSNNDWGPLTEYRFPKGDVKGHTLGNLILTALHEQYQHPVKAMKALHKLFAVDGLVLPVSYDFAELQAELRDGSILRGENKIDEPHAKSHISIKRVWLDPDPRPAEGVIKAIEQADLIIMGPGDLFTSIIPNLLVPGVAPALIASQAKKLYFCNILTKFGQTNRFTVSDHVRALQMYLKDHFFDFLVVNTSVIPPDLLQELRQRNEDLVMIDDEQIASLGGKVVKESLLQSDLAQLSDADQLTRSKVKNNPEAVLRVIKAIL